MSLGREGRPGIRRVRVNHVGLKGPDPSDVLIRCRVRVRFAWASWVRNAAADSLVRLLQSVYRLSALGGIQSRGVDSLVVWPRARNRRLFPVFLDGWISELIITYNVLQSKSLPDETRGEMIDDDDGRRRKSRYSGGKNCSCSNKSREKCILAKTRDLGKKILF